MLRPASPLPTTAREARRRCPRRRRPPPTSARDTCSARGSSRPFSFHLVDRCQYLPDLVRLGLAAAVLDVHPRVSAPRHPVHAVRTAPLARFSEVVITHLDQVAEPDIGGTGAHALEQPLQTRHPEMIPVLILSQDHEPPRSMRTEDPR